jgi:hypothetical protein
VSFSVPCTATWCGFELQCATGTQLNEPIRTTATFAGAGRVGFEPPEVPGWVSACVPPGVPAHVAAGAAAQSSRAAAAAARGLHRVCAPLLVKT